MPGRIGSNSRRIDGGASPPVVASIAEDEPLPGDTGWAIAIANNGPVTATFTPYVVCAS